MANLKVWLVLYLASFSTAYAQDVDLTDNDAQVLILGAGPGGIEAAVTLLKNNVSDFIIVEGSSEPRGILKLTEFGGLEFGGYNLWAYPAILPALDMLNITYRKSNSDSLIVRSPHGEDITNEARKRLRVFKRAVAAADEISADIDEGKRPDISQKAALAISGWVASSDVDNAIEWFRNDFEHGLGSRDVSLVGPYRQGFDFIGDQYFILNRRGGASLENKLNMLEEGHLRLNQIVKSVDQSGERVVVTTEDGTQYTADYVIVTFSIGVLQRGRVSFNPPLPSWKTEQIFRYRMGTIDPIFLKFETKFWDDAEFILHASGRPGYYPLFVNSEAEGRLPSGTNILIGFVTGDEAHRVENLSDQEIQDEVIDVLKGMYGAENVPDPTEFYMARWATDPFHYGTFSTWPIGNIPMDAMLRIRAHINRVFFAQDASDERIGIPFGYTSAARRSASKIVSCLGQDECPGYEPVEAPLCEEEKPRKKTKPRKNKTI